MKQMQTLKKQRGFLAFAGAAVGVASAGVGLAGQLSGGDEGGRSGMDVEKLAKDAYKNKMSE
ncbi:MAG: hypothetical protein ACREXR_00420, partial [Gammaproteobacteria bacterium]